MTSIKKYVTARLPDEYQEVEYLESTARSGFGIDTEYIPTQDTTMIVRAVKEGWSLFGSGANNYTFTGGGTNNRHYGYLGNANSNYIPGDTWHTEFHDWKVEGRRFWCDDTPADTNYVGGNVPTVSLYLFCRNNNGINDGGFFKVAWCKIIENGVLMRHLIPCYRKSDDMRGFYDLAAGENDKKFYTNIGSGTFAKGADVNSSGWQPTGKLWTTKSEDLTLPATINSNGTAITAYTVKGNTVQDGTPTPSSPVAVEEFGDYISQAVIDNILTNTTLTITEPTPTVNKTTGVGRVTVTATRGVPEDSGLTIVETGFIYVKDTSVTTALTLENVGKDGIAKNIANPTTGSKTLDITDPKGKGARVVPYAVATDGDYVVQIYSQEAKATYQELKDEQEQGTTVSHLYPAPDNVTHIGEYQIPITNNDTKQFIYLTEPLRKISTYADSVNSEGVVTRRIGKIVLTGEESWRLSGGNLFSNVIDNTAASSKTVLSTHFVSTSSSGLYIFIGENRLKLFANSFPTGVTDSTSMKTWLAQQYTNGTPVTIWYVLATPETSSQAGVSIPTVAGDNTISVDTTVQPSKFTATWTGWHELVGKVFDGTNWI